MTLVHLYRLSLSFAAAQPARERSHWTKSECRSHPQRQRAIFAVQVAPGLRYPDVITNDKKIIANSFVLPDEALASVPAGFR